MVWLADTAHGYYRVWSGWQVLLTGTAGYGLAGRCCSPVLLGIVWQADNALGYYWVWSGWQIMLTGTTRYGLAGR